MYVCMYIYIECLQTWKIDPAIFDVWMASLKEDLPSAYLLLWAQSPDSKMNLGMYVCMYACMFVCLFVCLYVCVYACTYVCICIDTYIMRIYVNISVHPFTYAKHIQAHTYAHTTNFPCANIHTYDKQLMCEQRHVPVRKHRLRPQKMLVRVLFHCMHTTVIRLVRQVCLTDKPTVILLE